MPHLANYMQLVHVCMSNTATLFPSTRSVITQKQNSPSETESVASSELEAGEVASSEREAGEVASSELEAGEVRKDSLHTVTGVL